jgi:hypothetical protein
MRKGRKVDLEFCSTHIPCIIFALLIVAPCSSAFAAFRPETIEGWTVFIDQDLANARPELTARVRSEIEDKLHTITTLLPGKRITELRRVPIFVWQGPQQGGGAYYANGSGFRADGAPASGVVGAVAIAHPADLLEWLKNVPSGLLHELTHAYHNQVLGLFDPAIKAAYRNAVDRHLYEHVTRYNGRIVARSYALANEKEYFALLTQAYYWRSSFYPFTNDQLKTYDPVGYETVRSAWEDRPGPQPSEQISINAERRSCTRIAQDNAGDPQSKAVLGVHNWANTDLSLFWISGAGIKVPYGTIVAGGYKSQPTRASENWEIDSYDSCLVTITADGLGNHLDVFP